MVCYTKSVYIAFLFIIRVYGSINTFRIPEVELQALRSGGFRAYIPGYLDIIFCYSSNLIINLVGSTKYNILKDTPGISSFHLTANINRNINGSVFGELISKATSPTNGYWIIQFNYKLRIGDVINYWVVVQLGLLAFRKDGLSWTVRDLVDAYDSFDISRCSSGITVINGGKNTCTGQLVFADDFKGPSINRNNWIVEHRIPTYTGPSYEFNSYEDIHDTRFFKNGKLYLKPIALQSEDDVHGILNLEEGCTSNDDSQCFYKQASSFLLPPVKSAKITSKTSFKYGKIEIRAQLPAGEWIFPVIQLEPKRTGNENSTKIWLAYTRGNNHLTGNDGIDIGSSLLFAGPVMHPTEPVRSKKLVTRRSRDPYNRDFHVYTLELAPGKMSFFVDGELYGLVDTNKNNGFDGASLGVGNDWDTSKAALDEEFVLSLGVAVGGFNDFPDGFMSGNNRKPWTNGERNSVRNFFDAKDVWLRSWNGDNTALKIDYVKVWAL